MRCPRSRPPTAMRPNVCSSTCGPPAGRPCFASPLTTALSLWMSDSSSRWGRSPMHPEAALAVSPPAPVANRSALTRRASLNALQALLDYGAKLIVTFVVTPMLVTGLGRSLYVVWEMLARLIGYMSASDARPMEALRLVIATRQGLNDPAGHRRAVGSALIVWAFFFPLVVAVGVVLVWLARIITKVTAELRPTVRGAAVLLVGSFFIAAPAT